MEFPSLIGKVFADATGIVGTIDPGDAFKPYGNLGPGVTQFFSNLLRLVFVGGGVYAVFNLIVAGFTYMQAGGDPKMLTAAWARIWQTLLGLLIVVGSFALASLFGYIIFGDPGFMLHLKVYGPR